MVNIESKKNYGIDSDVVLSLLLDFDDCKDLDSFKTMLDVNMSILQTSTQPFQEVKWIIDNSKMTEDLKKSVNTWLSSNYKSLHAAYKKKLQTEADQERTAKRNEAFRKLLSLKISDEFDKALEGIAPGRDELCDVRRLKKCFSVRYNEQTKSTEVTVKTTIISEMIENLVSYFSEENRLKKENGLYRSAKLMVLTLRLCRLDPSDRMKVLNEAERAKDDPSLITESIGEMTPNAIKNFIGYKDSVRFKGNVDACALILSECKSVQSTDGHLDLNR